MFCPQCGQQQVSNVTRFCSRCGFPLESVTAVLASGGALPASLHAQGGYNQLSPRSKGIRQGAMIMLSTLLLVPLVAIFSVFVTHNPEVLIPITAITCFVGGLLRILYALLFEDSAPRMNLEPTTAYAPPQLDRPPRQAALPPQPASAGTWRPNPNTAEIYQPPSITENTTRLLDKDDKRNR